jgi:hypothetical protein
MKTRFVMSGRVQFSREERDPRGNRTPVYLRFEMHWSTSAKTQPARASTRECGSGLKYCG